MLLLLLLTQLTACRQSETVQVTVSLKPYSPAFRNPMKGLREFFQPAVDRKREEYPYPYGSIIKEYMQWNMLEDDSTDGVDKIIAYSNHRWKGYEAMNMKVIPRVYLVWVEPWHGGRSKDPHNPDDLNGTHWPKGIPEEQGPYRQKPGQFGATVAAADKDKPITGGYFHPGFASRVSALVEKLGKAWDNDPRVAYVEMGIVGEWGEHHDPDLSTYWPPHDEPEHVANRTWVPGLEKVLGDAFTRAFRNKKVMVRYAYEFKDYQFGIYWDSWSQKEEEQRGYQEMLKLGDRWKTQPIGGEITWNWGGLAKFKSFEQVVADEEYFALTMKQIRNLHANHLGGITWADFNDPEFKTNAAALQKALGYRFEIQEASYTRQVQPEQPFAFSFKVVNSGSSPFYYQWPVALVLLDTASKKPVWQKTLDQVAITRWMPGDHWDEVKQKYDQPAEIYSENASVTLSGVPEGKYILALAVLDPAGMQPSLRFANHSYIRGGYTALGYLGVNKAVDTVLLPDSEFSELQSDSRLHYTGLAKSGAANQ